MTCRPDLKVRPLDTVPLLRLPYFYCRRDFDLTKAVLKDRYRIAAAARRRLRPACHVCFSEHLDRGWPTMLSMPADSRTSEGGRLQTGAALLP